MTKFSKVSITFGNLLVLDLYAKTRPLGMEMSMPVVDNNPETYNVFRRVCALFQGPESENMPLNYLEEQREFINPRVPFAKMLHEIYGLCYSYQQSKATRTRGVKNPIINDPKYLIAILIGAKAKKAAQSLSEKEALDHLLHLRQFIEHLCQHPEFFKTLSNDTYYTSLRFMIFEIEKKLFDYDVNCTEQPNGLVERLKFVAEKIPKVAAETETSLRDFDEMFLDLATPLPKNAMNFIRDTANELDTKNNTGQAIVQHPLFNTVKELMGEADLDKIKSLSANTLSKLFSDACGSIVEIHDPECEAIRELLLMRVHVAKLGQELSEVNDFCDQYGVIGLTRVIPHVNALVNELQIARQKFKDAEINFMRFIFELYDNSNHSYKQIVIRRAAKRVDLSPLVDLNHIALELQQLTSVHEKLKEVVLLQANDDAKKLESGIERAIQYLTEKRVTVIEPSYDLAQSMRQLSDGVKLIEARVVDVICEAKNDDDEFNDFEFFPRAESDSEESALHRSFDSAKSSQSSNSLTALDHNSEDLDSQEPPAQEIERILSANSNMEDANKLLYRLLQKRNVQLQEAAKKLKQAEAERDSMKSMIVRKTDEHNDELDKANAAIAKEKIKGARSIIEQNKELFDYRNHRDQQHEFIQIYFQNINQLFDNFVDAYKKREHSGIAYFLHGKTGLDRADEVKKRFNTYICGLRIDEIYLGRVSPDRLIRKFFNENASLLNGKFREQSLNTYLYAFYRHLYHLDTNDVLKMDPEKPFGHLYDTIDEWVNVTHEKINVKQQMKGFFAAPKPRSIFTNLDGEQVLEFSSNEREFSFADFEPVSDDEFEAESKTAAPQLNVAPAKPAEATTVESSSVAASTSSVAYRGTHFGNTRSPVLILEFSRGDDNQAVMQNCSNEVSSEVKDVTTQTPQVF